MLIMMICRCPHFSAPTLKVRCLSQHGIQQDFSPSLFHGFRHLLLFSTSSSLSSETHSFADYLMQSLSFSRQQASLVSAKLTQIPRAKKVSDLDFIGKADSIIKCLKHYGFDQSHTRKVIIFQPGILMSRADKTLKPKLEILQKHGLSGAYLAKFVSANPTMLLRGLDSTILPAFKALTEILGSGNDDDLALMIKRIKGLKYDPFLAVNKFLLANVALLQDYGIPMELIRKHLVAGRSSFIYSKSLKDKLIRVEEKLGIPRDSRMFLYGVHLLVCNHEKTIESKCRLFKSFGWTQSDIVEMMRRNPNCFWFSETRIKKSLEFLMKELGYEPKCVISNPSLLICNLERTLVPRHRVITVLKEKGLIRKDYKFYSAVHLSELIYQKKFVLPFKEVHQYYAELTGFSVGAAKTRKQRRALPKMKSNSNSVG